MTKTAFEQLQAQLNTTPDEAHFNRMRQHIMPFLEELLKEIPDDADRLLASLSAAKSLFYSIMCNLDAELTPLQVVALAESAASDFFAGHVAAVHLLSKGKPE